MSDQDEEYKKAVIVKDAYKEMLLGKANVVGVGIGFARRGQQQTKQIALVVMVSRKLPPEALSQQDILPTEIEGIPVDVQQTGTLYAQS
jgi:hypothetical protein